MKKQELLEKYNIKKIAIKELNFFKIYNENSRKGIVFVSLSYFFISIISFITNIYAKQFFPTFYWIITLAVSLGSFYVLLYLMLTIKDIYDSSDNYIMSIAKAKIKPVAKTFSASLIYLLFFAAGLAGIILIVVLFCNHVLNIYFYDQGSLIIGYIYTVLVFIWMLRYFFSSYIAILMNIKGFDAAKLSTIFLNKNKVFAFIIPLIYWAILFLEYYFTLNTENTYLILTSSVVQSLISLILVFSITLSIFRGINVVNQDL